MNILLTGATGFLGFRTLEKMVLDPRVKKITATGRTLKEDRTIRDRKINYVLGDLSDKNFVQKLFENQIDIIVNTASLSSPWGNKEVFEQANVTTQNILLDMSVQHKIKRFIYISSPSIYYNGNDRYMVKEDHSLPTKFVNNYASTKRKAELLLINSGLEYIILRPRAIIGRGDTVIMPRLIEAHKKGKLKIIGKGNNKVDLTSVSNVVHSILLSINANESAVNHIFNITNGKPSYLWESINFVLKELGKETISQKIPFKIAYLAAFFAELYATYISKSEPPINRYSVGILSKNFTLDISKSKEKLKYEPLVTTKQSIKEFVNWYKNEKS